MIFLIHYSRHQGMLVSMRNFDDDERDQASSAKVDLEISLLEEEESPEIVLLEADSEDALRLTHGRYFRSLAQLKSSADRQ